MPELPRVVISPRVDTVVLADSHKVSVSHVYVLDSALSEVSQVSEEEESV